MADPDINEWSDMMPDTITLDAFVSRSVSGVPTYANNPVPYPARINLKNHRVINARGREVTARGRVYVGTTILPSVEDKLTLPAGYVPLSPPIIAANPVSDESGTHHIVLEIG